MQIRRFQEQDARAVSDLVRDALLVSCAKDYPPDVLTAFAETQTPECMLNRGNTTHFYVAEEEERIIGCGAIGTSNDCPDVCGIYSLYVSPEYQAKGIGKRIMETLEADPYAQQASQIEIHASITALEFYQKLGYTFQPGGDVPDHEGLYKLEKQFSGGKPDGPSRL